MYRLLLYYLLFLIAAGMGLGFFGLLQINPWLLLLSTITLVIICWLVNLLFASVFEAPTNVESLYISAFILALIITPVFSFSGIMFLVWASIWAMASKFIFAINKKHVFNPVAFAVVLTAFVLGESASWWVGTLYMAPFVIIGGLMIVRKIRRFDLVLSFLITSLAIILLIAFFRGNNLLTTANNVVFGTPLLFFAFVMLTEPLTTPPTRLLRILYGAIVGFLFTPLVQIGSVYFTPEIALLVGNIFSYLVSSKEKLVLKLKEKVQIGTDAYDFIFEDPEKFYFHPGQYMEWTLPMKSTDSRGNRRYFTLSSSPTEEDIRIGVKFNENSSAFKKQLKNLKEGDVMVASQLSGEFTLPHDHTKKLVFIAGGIGITPFRSMLKYLVDRKEKRDITLFYSCRNFSDVAYQKVFDEAQKELGIKVICTITDATPSNWKGKTGYVDEKMIKTEVPDYKERMFYLSGPHSMVTAFEETLKKMGVKDTHIIIDYFPGFA